MVKVPKSVVSGVSMLFMTAKNAAGSGVFALLREDDLALVLKSFVHWAESKGLLSENGMIDVSSWITK